MGIAYKSERDLVGQTFGRLTVIAFGGRTKSRRFWLCRCSCGNECRVREDGLRANTRSCGCLHREMASAQGASNTRHGHNRNGRRTPTYVTWVKMRRRCLVPDDEHYPLYGGRGIKICERWLAFENFLTDMGTRPHGHTLERINNDGHYEPSNCRWATQKEQGNNTRANVAVEYQGVTKTATEWAEYLGWPRRLVAARLRAGWSVERALTTPPKTT